jgi:small subunit ribosomal protein S20
MAHTLSARKRIRQNVTRSDRNKPFRTRAAAAVRDARAAIDAGDADASERVRAAQSALDRAARRKIIHPNSAARRKARLSARLKSAQA